MSEVKRYRLGAGNGGKWYFQAAEPPEDMDEFDMVMASDHDRIVTEQAKRVEELEWDNRRLRGEGHELYDTRRRGLFAGTAIDYVRMRATKHERVYIDLKQASHLRHLAQETEDVLKEQAQRIKELETALQKIADDAVNSPLGVARAALANKETP